MTKDELKQFNGRDGKPVYVGYKGKVYDVSASDLWELGSHMDEHYAGQDLTEFMELAPHDEDNILRHPVVDDLVD